VGSSGSTAPPQSSDDGGTPSSSGANNSADPAVEGNLGNPPSGCGCSTVGGHADLGGLAFGLGLVAGLAARRRRAAGRTR
jgi:MYXO-CTERM domain-containing protein